MKNTNACPKCGSAHIVFVKGTELPKDDPIYAGIVTNVRVDRYVCADCGYMERWVNRNDMRDLIKYYKD